MMIVFILKQNNNLKKNQIFEATNVISPLIILDFLLVFLFGFDNEQCSNFVLKRSWAHHKNM